MNKTGFKEQIIGCQDLYSELQNLLDHVYESTGATAGYIGKVNKPILGTREGLAEDAKENAHIIPDAEDQIQFMYTTNSVDYLYERTLSKDVGVTYKLFRDDQCHRVNPIIIDETKEGVPKHIFVPDVVREKEMFYYKYPRLGSYMAIKLEFNSCLSEEAFDAAVENY